MKLQYKIYEVGFAYHRGFLPPLLSNNPKEKKTMNSSTQITVKPTKINIQLYLNMPAFKHPKKYAKIRNGVLRLKDKTSRNLFHLYGDGLGLNTELLNNKIFEYEYIECMFEGQLLRTTREHFKKKGIPSRYISKKVDHQFILKLIDWIIPNDNIHSNNLNFTHKQNPSEQLCLFSEVA